MRPVVHYITEKDLHDEAGISYILGFGGELSGAL